MPRVDGPAPPATLLLPSTPDFLHLQARRLGPRGGLFASGRHVPLGELAEATTRLAQALARLGLGARDPIAWVAGNSPAAVAMPFAVWGIGAAAVPMAARSTAQELCQLAEHARARAILCDETRLPTAREAAGSLGLPLLVCPPSFPLRVQVARRGTVRKPAPPRTPGPQDTAVIAYTSGTTGAPKGVVLTHANLLWSSLACGAARGDTATSVGASISPLTHTPVFVSHLLCRILHGSATVLFDGFDVPALLDATARHGITDLPLIAGMVFDVVRQKRLPRSVRASVRKVSVGGAATPMEAKRSLAALFPDAEIIEAYGQSESTNGVAMARGTSVFDRPGTIGCANPFVLLAVRRPDGSLCDDGEEGEIVIGGPTLMSGYLRDRAATAAAIRQGWLHSGDLGRRDADGYFYITGRVKNLIITGGENVSPVEVEEVLRTHPDVADVAVIGTPHPKWGEQVTAIIVARRGRKPDPEALARFAGEHLAGFKKPRRVEFVDRLPRNAANKVQTALLKEQFGA